MPFARPTLPQIAAQIKAGFQAVLAGADLALRRGNLPVAAILVGGALDGEYGYLDWIIENVLMPDSAIAPYANRWGALKNVTQKGPVAATGTANNAGNIVGTDFPAGTQLQLQPGIVFATTEDATVAGDGTLSVSIAAVLPSNTSDGSQWNCDAGATLTLVQAVGGINGTFSVTADIDNGAASESIESYRARYLAAFRAPPQGGDQNDYVEWAEAVSIVTRAWCIPNGLGPGTVQVYFMCDVTEAEHNGFPQGTNGVASAETRDIPATGDQLIVANAIYPLRPVTALVYACAPVASPQNFTLKYVPPSSQSAVSAAIAAVLTEEGAPDGVTLVELADIQAAVRAVPGCATALVISPTDNISVIRGSLPTLGTPTFL